MSVYSVQLAKGNLSGTQAHIFTPSSGFTYVLRDLEVGSLNETGTAFFNVLSGSGSAFPFFNVTWTTAGFLTAQWAGRVVLANGDIVTANSTGSGFSFILSGYELEGAPLT